MSSSLERARSEQLRRLRLDDRAWYRDITNLGEHLIRRITEELFYELHAPPKLLASGHLPGIGRADSLEMASVPQKDGIKAALAELARHEP